MRLGLFFAGLCCASVAEASPIHVVAMPVASTVAAWPSAESWSPTDVWSPHLGDPRTAPSFAAQMAAYPGEVHTCWHAGTSGMSRSTPVPLVEGPDLRVLAASPVPGVESSGFGWRSDPIHHRDKFHRGTDYRAKRGTPVYAAGFGQVTFTGRQHGYGNVIYLDHGGGIVTRYAHLARIEVRAGDVVAAAGRIGQVGSTGRATGPHLHFEVRLDGRSVDPVLAMQVAELARDNPRTARVAARALAPDIQNARVDRHDPPRRNRLRNATSKRPDRTTTRTRSRQYW